MSPLKRNLLLALLASTIVCVTLTVICGVVGHVTDRESTWTETIFRISLLSKLDPGDPKSRWLVATRVFAGLSILHLAIWGSFEFWKKVGGMIGPSRLYRHTIVSGLNDLGCNLFYGCAQQRLTKKWIGIAADADDAGTKYVEGLGARVVIGDAANAAVLDKADIMQASCLFAVTDDDELNLETARVAVERLASAKRSPADKARIFIHQRTANLAANEKAFRAYRQRNAEVVIFSEPRNIAAKLVMSHEFLQFAPYQNNEVAHYFLVGFGTQGRELALQLALYGHFPNQKRARFTIADREIAPLAEGFLSEFGRFTAWNKTHPQIGVSKFSAETDDWNGRDAALSLPFATPPSAGPHAVDYVTSAKFRDLPGNIADEVFLSEIGAEAAAEHVKPVVLVCPPAAGEGLSIQSLREMRTILNRYVPRPPPIFFYTKPGTNGSAELPPGVFPFGGLQGTAVLESMERSTREYFAALLHEAHQELMRRKADLAKTKSPQAEDFKANPWENLDAMFVESSRQAAEHLLIKLWMLGFELVHERRIGLWDMPFPTLGSKATEILSGMEHNRWNAERLLGKWSWGAKKIVDSRLHPMLVPTEHLKPADRLIDTDQIREALLKAQKENYYLREFTKAPRVPFAK